MNKYIWIFVGVLNAATFFVSLGRGEPDGHLAFIAILVFYVAFKEWETESLLRDVKQLSKRLKVTVREGWSA